ncbi:hypothetical protein DFH08DRAFT_814678 [Mycena albidolilacea]|uniref:Wax synthase domain-containing protein n=1 Tax=Mycena albidolilacea TaxID=1033008 RepID=A0AAD6ZPH7_9AGAR|nr:hypothetical protein DFH08DRAFT_814678 [Mycena albidolilacea]
MSRHSLLMPPLSNSLVLALTTIDTCDDINQCRTLFSIVQICLTTVFLCTWVSLHLNVPQPGLGFFACTRRRLRMLLITLIAPELMFGFAARQYVVAKWLAGTYGVSRTHGFFLCMGGFVTRDSRDPTVTHPIMAGGRLGASTMEAIKYVRKEDIEDKSKADNLSKLWTLLQVGWFTVCCAARLKESLPLSGLETAAVGFAFIHCCTWLLWRKKPRDVSEPIIIDPPDWQTHSVQRDPTNQVQNGSRSSSDKDSDAQTLVGSVRTGSLDGPLSKTWKKEARSSHRHLTIGDRLNAAVLGDYREFDPVSANAVPLFWSVPFGEGPEDLPFVLAGQLICAILFGVVHCLAWNTHFPSIIEMWLWRACAVFISAFPLLCFLILRISAFFETGSLAKRVLTYSNYVLAAFYVIARIALLVLPFTSLRDSPPATFKDVDWSWRALF